jgi:hypothetical protein
MRFVATAEARRIVVAKSTGSKKELSQAKQTTMVADASKTKADPGVESCKRLHTATQTWGFACFDMG